jgi:hypothetical protein
MARYVTEIVAAEGPVHENEIVTRIRSAWGLARAGNRVRDAVQAGIATARHKKAIAGGPFYVLPGQSIRVRSRAMVESAGLRKPEHLPPAEIDAALLAIVDANFGAQREQLIVSTARLLGFAATSAPLRGTMDMQIEALVSAGMLELDNGLLTRRQPAKPAAPREPADVGGPSGQRSGDAARPEPHPDPWRREHRPVQDGGS